MCFIVYDVLKSILKSRFLKYSGLVGFWVCFNVFFVWVIVNIVSINQSKHRFMLAGMSSSSSSLDGANVNEGAAGR